MQRLTLQNGKAPSGQFFPQNPASPKCAWGYKEGSGGALLVRNAIVRIIDSQFLQNEAALVGPDVGGGAVYVLGVPELTISGTIFEGNRAANGGAVGVLFAQRPTLVNNVFRNNTAEGVGMNYVEPGCPNFNHDAQGGAGGNGAAYYMDGLSQEGFEQQICGVTFATNRANELAGAIFRTPNAGVRPMRIEQSLFDSNTARGGAVSFIKDQTLTVVASTFMRNKAGILLDGTQVQGFNGGLWLNTGTLVVHNSTFYENTPGALSVEGSGEVVNSTFVGNGTTDRVTYRNSLFVDAACNATGQGEHNVQFPAGARLCVVNAIVTDPALGAIGDHGGATPTLVPAAATLMIGQACLPQDQRGLTRNTSGCTVGAVEP